MAVQSGALSSVLMLIGFGLSNSVNPIGFLYVSEVSPGHQRAAHQHVRRLQRRADHR
ncbi:hypothetical protein ACFV2N_17070 [Streptomyces sp. NPDC059680]|uniref:hypothetical protein n=1 Tax=Streptomyces sp. NPDC059680 TaxID=3346904 RepID=UPI003695240D